MRLKLAFFVALLSVAGLVQMGLVAVASPAGPPGQPTLVRASGWNQDALVTWGPPKNGGRDPVAAYRITASPGTAAALVESRTWGFVSGLANGVTYRFTVTAINEAGRRGVGSKPSNPTTPMPVAVHVQGNQLVNAAGQILRLIGVNRSGTEYRCVIGGTIGAGIFSGPTDRASVAAMMSWHINAVRLPLNEDCWLGINGVAPAYGGENYRKAIVHYVRSLNRSGLLAILDLHWNAAGSRLSTGQQGMADADHAPTFWASVATVFRNDPGVIFDLYNEPDAISWECWRSGCETRAGWRTAGMQLLIDTVRATGANQPIIAAGLDDANDLSGWLSHPLNDPLGQLIAGVHVYNKGPPGYCDTVACWNRSISKVAARVPVVTGELGEFDGGYRFVTRYMRWSSQQWRLGHGISFLGWSWDPALGQGGPSLVTSFDGTPSSFGAGFRAYLDKLFVHGDIREG